MSGKSNSDLWLSAGLKAALPICLGYVPIGLAFGVLAGKAGLSPFQIALMSAVVFAGSSQFIAVSMLAQGADAYAIIATTFIVNLRHLLMGSALSIYLGQVRKGALSLFAYGVTDESFAVNLANLREGNWGIKPSLVVNQAANLTWILSTIAGGLGGAFIPQNAFGIEYAFPAMFICLLVFQLRGRKYVLTAIVAGVLAVTLSLLMAGNWYIILASMLAATIGVLLRPWFG
ncbi:MAG: AzlC family ABC transporter permease [Chloroflexota bacterium]